MSVNYENYSRTTQRKKCPYSEFFWSVFSRIWIEYGPEKLRIRTLLVPVLGLGLHLYFKSLSSRVSGLTVRSMSVDLLSIKSLSSVPENRKARTYILLFNSFVLKNVTQNPWWPKLSLKFRLPKFFSFVTSF